MLRDPVISVTVTSFDIIGHKTTTENTEVTNEIEMSCCAFHIAVRLKHGRLLLLRVDSVEWNKNAQSHPEISSRRVGILIGLFISTIDKSEAMSPPSDVTFDTMTVYLSCSYHSLVLIWCHVCTYMVCMSSIHMSEKLYK